jgi:hypothetical protein
MSDVTIKTNHVPRDIIFAHELTEREREQFDYLDWPAIDEGRDSAEFFRYRGYLYNISDFQRVSGLGSFLDGWDGYAPDSFFSGVLIRWPVAEPANRYHGTQYDYERIIVGTYYS